MAIASDGLTTVLTDQDSEYVNLKVDVNGQPISVRIEGWTDLSQALAALYMLGKPESIIVLANQMEKGLEEAGL